MIINIKTYGKILCGNSEHSAFPRGRQTIFLNLRGGIDLLTFIDKREFF